MIHGSGDSPHAYIHLNAARLRAIEKPGNISHASIRDFGNRGPVDRITAQSRCFKKNGFAGDFGKNRSMSIYSGMETWRWRLLHWYC
ncbi:MAG: hypothetical protein R2860_08180 [Desulfobacterales bacterium]